MTLTLQLKPEVETVLRLKAEKQGLSLDDYARNLLENGANTPDTCPPSTSIRGKYARSSGSVEDFLRDKHAENEREIAKGF